MTDQPRGSDPTTITTTTARDGTVRVEIGGPVDLTTAEALEDAFTQH